MNQPIGYMIAGALSPKYYYGGRHDYVYYPDSWTDSDTGTYYEKGYYDENGTRYDNVAFAKNGKYENVVCHCEYCGRDTVLNLDAAADALTDLKCPGCTAPLTIRSELDEIVEEDPGAAAYSYAPTPVKKKKKKWPWILAIFVGLYLLGESELAKQEAEQGNPGTTQQIEYTENTGVQFGSRIGLVKTGENTYTYSDSSSADKTLVWDSDADSYYDRDSDCWLWYNTDVSPSIWQYWYEGISSDYEESGWMEHDAGGWGIEVADGQWIDLPEKYSTDRLWYIQD